MLSNLARRLVAAASWPRLGILLLAYAALLSTLSWCEGRIKAFSGGLGVPDLLQGFTAAELYQRFEAFGPEGRRIYAQAELVDMVYPPVYATFLAFVLSLAARKLLAEESRLRLLCLLPYGVLIFDYLENSCFFAVLSAWPARLDGVATLAGVFNVAKWAGVAVAMPLSALALLALGIRAVRGRA